MSASRDFMLIDRNYFNVLQSSVFSVTVQSRNTGHYWHIVPFEYVPGKISCIIYHNHHYGMDYHARGHGGSLQDCLIKIMSHDTYQLRKNEERKLRIRERIENKSRL